MDTTTHPTIRTNFQKRQYRTSEEKRRIVEETLAPGVSVATVSREHGINANQVFHWRKLYHAGLLRDGSGIATGNDTKPMRLLPVTVSADAGAEQQTAAMAVSTQGDIDREVAGVASLGVVELTLAKAQIRVTGPVDASLLRVVLECLRG